MARAKRPQIKWFGADMEEGKFMRPILIGAVLAALACAPAHAAWKEYTYKDLGIAKDFPQEPTMEKGVYKSPLANEAPEVTYSTTVDGITYKMEVVDFLDRGAEGANILGEASSILVGKAASFTVDDFPLYDKGKNSVYGVIIQVNKENGDHISSVQFFNKGRLYLIQAITPNDAPGKGSAGVSRFLDTEVFHLAGYGFDFATGHDYPIGDDDPRDRDTRQLKNYKPPAGYENVGKLPAQ